MRKFPKHINSKQDIINLLELYPIKTKAYLQNCINGYKGLSPICEYDKESDCITDDTHDFIKTEEDGIEKFIQREYKIIEGNDLDRLGITLEEAEAMVES